MSYFEQTFNKQLEEELKRFLFLGNTADANLLVLNHKKENLPEYIRLSSILIAFGFRRLFFRFMGDMENFFGEFMDGLQKIDGNLPLIDKWVNDFIGKIKNEEAQKLSRELWEARKQEAGAENFSLKKLFQG